MSIESSIEDFDEILVDEFIDLDDLFSLPFDFISNDDETIIEDNQTILSIPMINETLSPPSSSDVDHLSNLICRVCGAQAYGHNFDQITCESCKAFFRRNALKNLSDFQCRYSGSCIIIERTRRRCTYCRLKKCFDIQMRKDWIRTKEEQQLRQMIQLEKEQRKSTNEKQILTTLPIVVRKKRRLTTLMKTLPSLQINSFHSKHFLSNDDGILLNNITNAYQNGISETDGFRIYKCLSSSLVEYMNDESKVHESLIHFFKSIPQFKQINSSDQILLIKFNQMDLIHLHYILIRNFRENLLVGQVMSKWISTDFHEQISKTRHYFDIFIEYPLVLKLTLIVLLFSTSLSIPKQNDQFIYFKNRKQIYEYQNYYISLLWRYLNHLFEGKQAIQSLQIIITQMLRFQTLMNYFEQFVQQDKNRYSFNQLMKSLIQFE